MSGKTETPKGRIASLTAHVPIELAEAVRELADEGQRSVSREVAWAIRRHVETARASESRAETLGSAAGREIGVDPVAQGEVA